MHQNLARPPISIPPTANASVPLRVTLIIGSFEHSPLLQPLFDLHLPVSYPAPQHPEEPVYHPLPEIHHTFRSDPKTPYVILSAIGAGAVIAPWVVLLGLVRCSLILIYLCFRHTTSASLSLSPLYVVCARSVLLNGFHTVGFITASPTASPPPLDPFIRWSSCLIGRAALLVLG